MDRFAPVLSLWCLLASAFGQQYPFLPVAGSPENVKVLFQDSRGRLWLGADQPACFDGTRFFFLRDYGFPAAQVYEFSEDTTGAVNRSGHGWCFAPVAISRDGQPVG